MPPTSTPTLTPEYKALFEELRTSIAAAAPASKLQELQRQVDAIDLNLAGNKFSGHGDFTEDTLSKALDESIELKRMREVGKGRAVISLGDLNQIPMGRKTVLTGSSMVGTSGVIMPERVGPIVNLAQRRLFLRDLLFKGNKTSGNTVYFLKELTFVSGASPQAESAPKGETTNTFGTTSLPVQTLAHFLNISRQALDDAPALVDYIRAKLLYGLRYREEVEILSGDGTGQHLTGLIGQAASFNTGLLGTSYTKLDILRTSQIQVEQADETALGFFVLNPLDWGKIELTKSTQGEYIVGSPGETANSPSLWGKPVIVTTAIAAGTFLAGSSESADLIDRMDATLEISFENGTNFTSNVATILCEERTVLATYRPNAFVTGSLTTSPVS